MRAVNPEMIFMVGWFAGGTGSHRRWAPRQEGIKACLVDPNPKALTLTP